MIRLIIQSALYHWRTNLAVMLGVAAAVSVLSGALLVGDSVRGSLRDLALNRLGRTDQVVSSTGFFREALADDLRARLTGASTTPLVVATGFVTHEGSGRRAGDVLIYGVDERFWSFHGLPPPEGVAISPSLAAEFGAADGDVLLVRLQRPSEIPLESLFARKEEIGRTLRLSLGSLLPRERLGEFALRPQQAEVRAIFAPLRRVQRDLGVGERANAILVAGAAGRPASQPLKAAVRLEDLGVSVSVVGPPSAVAVEISGGVLGEALETAARNAGEAIGLEPLPVFTYLANTIRKGDREIPYSLITATRLDVVTRESRALSPEPRAPGADSIVLNEWAGRELQAKPGDRIEIDYYLWNPGAGLTTHSDAFTVAAVVPITGFAADRRLAPQFPGITDSVNLADWDPPFPIDLSRVRPQDEKYWDDHRTTPKAFIGFERGRRLWQTRYGGVTSVRFAVPAGGDAAAIAAQIGEHLRGALPPAAMGLVVADARADALTASTGATDFGEYFTYFSFFLVVSALLLAVLFFRLGIEQRLKQIGIMRAAGFTIAHIRRLFVTEALLLAAGGAVLGMAGAIAYAQVIVYGLRTWWVGAVGTELLTLHVSPVSLVIGAAAGLVAAVLCVVLSLRAVARLSPRALLTAQAIDVPTAADPRKARRARRIAAGCAVAGAALLALGFANRDAQVGAFFGAGAVLLVGCLFLLSAWLRARDARPVSGHAKWPVARLGFRSAAFRPARSVMSAALIGAAAFIIVSVDAFRRGEPEVGADQHSGTGGYVLIAESELPLLHNPNEAAGREALIVSAPEFARVRFTRFRVRPGDDASCLNLYRPTNPTIIAPEPGFIERGRFAFSGSTADSQFERANPWLLLNRTFDDGSVPVVADATSLQYVLHARVGDTFEMDSGSDRPLTLRFVAALADSVLQGQLVMSEENFLRLFPGSEGHRFFLIDAPGVRTAADAASLASILERELETFGFDAVSAAERLAAFHRVENTYLSTFQALGGLGLLLGTIGLAAVMFRNVLERRRELALLRAVGFNTHNVSVMIVAESALLLAAGLGAGALCAVLAVSPAWIGRGGSLPGIGLALLLAGVAAAGLLSSMLATRAAVRGNMLEALRAE